MQLFDRLFDYNHTSPSHRPLMTTNRSRSCSSLTTTRTPARCTREYLSFSGFRVVEASTGTEAVEKAFELRPDVILMDLSLPGMDGWAATRQLKTDDRTKRIPVVALTGHALAGRIGRCAARRAATRS